MSIIRGFENVVSTALNTADSFTLGLENALSTALNTADSATRGLENALSTALNTADSVTFNLISSENEFHEAFKENDTVGATQASLQHVTGLATAAHYGAKALNKGSMLISGLAQYLPFTIDPSIAHLLEGLTITQAIGGLGLAISALTAATNAIFIYRDSQLLAKIPENQEFENDTAKLTETLTNLESLNYNHFKKTLPEYLRKKIEAYGDKNIFTYLKSEVEAGYDVTARNIVAEIKDHVERSKVVHVLALIGSLVALTAGIGLIVGFPPVVLVALTVVGLIITVSCVALKKGWVDNPKEGFNWKLLFPEFIQKKLKVDHTIEEELQGPPAMEVATSVHSGIAPLPHFITQSEVSPKAVEEFLRSTEPEKKPTLWEKLNTNWGKLKAKFSREPKVAQPKVEPSRPQKRKQVGNQLLTKVGSVITPSRM